MTRHIIPCLTFGLFALTVASVLMAAAANKTLLNGNSKTTKLGQVSSPEELASQIADLVSGVRGSKLDGIVASPDCTAALAAGWERVRRTIPEPSQQGPVDIDRLAVSRFLGLVEGRLQCAIPEAWAASLKSAKAHSRWSIVFSSSELTKRGSMKAGTLRRDGGQWIVKTHTQSIRVPVRDCPAPIDDVAVQLGGGVTYVALYGWPPTPFRLLAVDRGSAGIMWSSKVWAAGGLISYDGLGWHLVEMRVAGDSVAVFGVSEGCAYVEVFDKRTGENRCRFSTMYFVGQR